MLYTVIITVDNGSLDRSKAIQVISTEVEADNKSQAKLEIQRVLGDRNLDHHPRVAFSIRESK